MTAFASWLVLLVVSLPIIGVLSAVTLIARRENHGAAATACVRCGMLASFVVSLLLVAVLAGAFGSQLDQAVWRMGTALELSGPRPLRIEWAWRADALAAGWAAALSGLAWLTMSSARRDERGTPCVALAVTAGMLHVSAVALVLSAGLVQMLFCWGAISLTTWLMVGWASTTDAASHAIRRTILTGLVTEGLLILAVLLMSVTSGSLVIDDVLSVDGLARLGQRNPALPGFIGCLLVLSVFGRSGLFPCFGWHHGAAAWDRPVWTLIYLVGYVPSAVWLLFRFQPLVAASDVTLTMLGGLSTLAAVLGAFVACGQSEPRSARGFLVTAQIGVVFAALSSGLFDVETLRASWLGTAEAAPRADDVGRVLLAQLAVIVGAFVVRRTSRATSPSTVGAAWYQPLAQLSRQRLYIDEVTQIVVEGPLRIWMQLAQFVERLLTDGLFPSLAIRLPGWFGRQFESLQVGRLEFDLATALLGVATLLLTLILVT
ncbi:MAG: hypothetical protein H7062_24760 [Candidatus Saccharimonas sp.]|nr:hypothetical protein [Planctomycetaceae bacterium]